MYLTTKRTSHLALSPWCSACDDSISQGEITLLFLGDDQPLSSCALPRAFPFPSFGISATEIDGFLLCLNPTCRTCKVSPECPTVHHQCFITFVQTCRLPVYQAIKRFRTIVFYRKPWAKAPQLYLSSGETRQEEFTIIEQEGDLASLRHLPQEVLDIIRRFSPQAWLWRLMSVVDLSRRAVQPAGPFQAFALGSIENWKRGGNIVTSDKSKSAIRVTIDLDGIQSIIRVSEQEAFHSQACRRHAYVVGEAMEFSGVQAHVQDGLLRMHLPSNRTRLLIWDTPSPPRVADCRLHPSLRWHRQRLLTINLSNIQGLTFFYSTGRIYGIFPHESKKSCPLPMYERFTKRRQKYTVWVYLPIGHHDKVLMLGTRQNDEDGLCIMMRTERGGDIIIGPQCRSIKCDRFLTRSRPSLLVVNEPSNDVPVMPAAYDPNSSSTVDPRRFVFPQYTPRRLGLSTYFSSAPLAEIHCAYVFEDEEHGFCRGMLFEYANGSSRAIGQCRVGVDRSKKYLEPLTICLRASPLEDQLGPVPSGVQVELGISAPSGHPRENWNVWVFPRKLHCWFSEQCTTLSVE